MDPELVFVRPCQIERSASTFWSSLTVDPELVLVLLGSSPIEISAGNLTVDPKLLSRCIETVNQFTTLL